MNDERVKLLDRHRRQQLKGLQTFGSLTWSRCVLSIITYGLFLSDVIRTGLGVRRLNLPTVEPGMSVLFGPYSYPVVHLTTANVSLPKATKRFWPYKYDTTSLAMRAVAKALRLPAWPSCGLYESTCEETGGLPGSVIFAMLDDLIGQVREHARSGSRTTDSLTLRIEHHRRDRLSEVVLPAIFYRTQRRSCQASFYTSRRLQSAPLCDPRARRPFSCLDLTSNFGPLCSSKPCKVVGRIYEHITRRLAMLQRAYPNASLELVVLDSLQDFSRGGLMSHGRRDFDIVTLVRARECTTNCSTVAVDDYRYEGIVFSSSERDWYPVVAMLRVVGQLYAWVRVVALVAAIAAVERPASTPLATKIWSVARTFFIVIPSHVVVYSSIIPVACYAMAHLLDANVVYERIRADFYALLGGFQFDFVSFFRLASVAMRTVWLIASACHGLTWVMTQRSWSRELGVLGVPELFIAFVSSFTVLAHIRIPQWRDCRVLQVHRVTSSQRVRDVKAHTFDNARGSTNKLLLSSTSDYQFIAVGLAVVAVISVIWSIVVLSLLPKLRNRLTVFSHTRVSYSSAWLWSNNALVVKWMISFKDSPSSTRIRMLLSASALRKALSSRKSLKMLTISVRRLEPPALRPHDQLLQLRYRSQNVLAFIVTLNLTVMSDPLVFYQLRRLNANRVVGLYEHQATGKLWLLPLQSSAACVDAAFDWDDLRRIAVFTTNELAWVDLLHCG
ncbi:hypothetical protein PINS_up022257 [Pythium insidiosum]|nr:hypothetical protein PINS_up022257 [Pythium insidiosum]